VVAFFDPKDETVTTPPEAVPARSWKMSDETRRWVLVGHDSTNQATLLRQIEEAEEKRADALLPHLPGPGRGVL